MKTDRSRTIALPSRQTPDLQARPASGRRSVSRGTPSRRERTLRDRLSRLSLQQAKRFFGVDAEARMYAGRTLAAAVDMAKDIRLTPQALVWQRGRRQQTAIVHDPMALGHVRLECSCGKAGCAHGGTLLGLVLQEKMALGLSAMPQETTPLEHMAPEALEERMLAERQQRAAEEPMTVQSLHPDEIWSDYTVTSGLSGKTHRVALRGWERGESYCSCPDFRTNTLGICKHIYKVIRVARQRFPAVRCRQPFVPDALAIYLKYGREPELRLQVPPRLSGDLQALVGPVTGRAITAVHDLLECVRRLETTGHGVVIYPDAEEYIQQWLHQDRLRDKVAAIRRDPASHPLRRELLKVELLPYQLDGVAFAVGVGRAVLADDMGLGKTIQGIGAAELLAREAGIQRVLVVCPVSLKAQWAAEIHRFSTRDARLIQGSGPERSGQYQGPEFFTIVNYEQVLRDITQIEKAAWDLIILDEGQRIKNWEAKTSRVIKGLRSRFALVLSGTPLENRLEELYSVVQFIDDRRLGPAFRFFHAHRQVDERGKVLGYTRLDELRTRLRPILLRRTRAMVMKELPPRTTEVVRITPTEEQRELSADYLKQVSAIIRKSYLTEMDLLRLQKCLLMARLAANGTVLVTKEPPNYSSKLEHLKSLLDTMAAEADRKVILFSEWTSMLDLIEPLLVERRAGYVRLDGSVPQRDRAALVQRFQAVPDCRFFLASNAGATGLNLQAANTVINVDLPWNPAVLEQRIARAHRMGQKRPVQVYLLVTEDTLEERLLLTLSAKKELALAALDMGSEVSEVQLQSGMSELKQRLEILLGTPAPAAADESRKAETETAARLLDARRTEVAAAGGQLLGAAFAFLGTLVPVGTLDSEVLAQRTTTIRESLAACLEKTPDGQCRLAVTLPDAAAVDGLAAALARLMALAKA